MDRSFLIKILLLFMVLLLPAPGTGFSETYFVSTAGDDLSSGTIENPFRTFSKASEIAAAGDTVYIRGGEYRERLRPRNSGNPSSTITFSSYGDEKVIINAKNQRQGVMLWGVSHIKIKGMTIINASHAGIHIHNHLDEIDNGSDNNVIEKNTVRKCGSEGYSGIYIGGNGNFVSENTVSENGRISKENPLDHGIYLLGSNNKITGNIVASNAVVGIRAEGENNIIERNQIKNNGDFGATVYVDAPLKGKNILISKNTFLDNRKGGISIYGHGSGEKPSGIKIYNNTIRSERSEFGIRIIHGPFHVKIMNNIIFGDYSGAILKIDSESSDGVEEDYNNYYGTGGYFYRDKRYMAFPEYKKVSKSSAHSITENPFLGIDFMPLSISPVIDKGKDIGFPFYGKAPDIGAKEFRTGSKTPR